MLRSAVPAQQDLGIVVSEELLDSGGVRSFSEWIFWITRKMLGVMTRR